MDWNAIQQYLPLYQKAAVLTLRLGVAGILCAIVIGLVCAVIQYDKIPVLRQIVGVYIQISRNTPLLVQLFFIYYGLPKVGIRTNAEICGIAGLAFLGGSYMAEAFRSGLEAVEPIQTESAYSLGMNKMQTMRYIIIPQAFKSILPPLGNEFIVLIKETSIVGYVGMSDLTRVANQMTSKLFDVFTPLLGIAFIYFVLTKVLSILLAKLERRLRKSDNR